MPSEADSLATMRGHGRPDLQEILVGTYEDLNVCAEEMMFVATQDYSKTRAEEPLDILVETDDYSTILRT